MPRFEVEYDRGKLFSVSDLKERGWTDTAIKSFLPAPDDTRPNPTYSNAGAPMKFWTKARVRRVEKTKRFLAWRDGVVQRRQAAERAVLTRVKNMCDKMASAELTIERGLTDKQIYDLAVSTHGGNYDGDPGPFRWSNRTARNCIRHNLTNYESMWSLTNRGGTGEEAYGILRERVDALIDEAYPQFSDASDDRLKMPLEVMREFSKKAAAERKWRQSMVETARKVQDEIRTKYIPHVVGAGTLAKTYGLPEGLVVAILKGRSLKDWVNRGLY